MSRKRNCINLESFFPVCEWLKDIAHVPDELLFLSSNPIADRLKSSHKEKAKDNSNKDSKGQFDIPARLSIEKWQAPNMTM